MRVEKDVTKTRIAYFKKTFLDTSGDNLKQFYI